MYKCGLVLPLLAFGFCSVLQAYKWTSTLEENMHVSACVDGNVSFPWSMVTEGKEEKILDIDWLFQAPGKENVSFATYVDDNFVTNKDRFTFIPNAGLFLQGAQSRDAGRYYVIVSLHDPKCRLTSAQRMVTLTVADRPPATRDDALHVTLRDAVRDDVTEDWTLQLHCGLFVDFGHPPADVVWTTPSGEVRNSSFQDNGTFVLSVSSPVQGGNYSCQLHPSARCLTATSPLNAAAQLYVDDKDVRLSFLEARQKEIVIQLSNLSTQFSQLNEKMDHFFNNPKELIKHRNSSSCVDWLEFDQRSGVQTVYVSGEPVTVYCDQTTDNGGWIVFQRRNDASVDFYRGWAEYRIGFGDPMGNFWLGLDTLHSLTTSRSYELRVDLQKYDLTKGHATYSGFYVEGAPHNFALHFDKFVGGNAGDSLSFHRGQQFSTKDRDHDNSGGCAQKFHGAWWFHACLHSNLNGDYGRFASSQGLNWLTFGSSYSMKFTEMKIRPM
uniref:VIgL family fibrinogen-related protein 2 isoform 1 n=1 Tax=Littorina littorea TaxID=31216 RepID=A0A411DEN4_LITLI|nr:VIgL family fibrinogen-related protein 2 isoform 1 [Littorina littorea]